MNKSGSILIADDEELACRALETILGRYYPQMEIIAKVANGREAIEAYDTLKPDLVFMDIKMPGISGTEAASRILQRDPAANIIMLTAYDNFNFAQEAINTGVKAYLLKPINANLLTKTVQNVMYKRLTDRQENSSSGITAYLDTEMVNALSAHKPQWNKIASINSLSEKKLTGGFFVLISGDITLDEILSLIQEFSSRQNYIYAPVYGFMAIVVLQKRENYTPGNEVRIANRIFNEINGNYPNCCRLAYGPWKENPEGIRESYEICLKILMNQSSNGIYGIQDLQMELPPGDEEKGSEICRIHKEILLAIETGRIGKCRKTLKEMVQYLRNIPGDFTNMKEIVNDTLVHLKNFSINKKQIPGASKVRILFDLSRIQGQRQLALYLEESISRFLGDETPLGRQETKTLMDAFLYLQEHIFDEISLEQIADLSGVSPQYLSLKIKEKFDMNFVDYLTGKRLEYARYLLMTTNDPIKEIAHKSGYPDANYFSRIFKKNLGQTALQFRSDVGEKEE